MADLTITTVKKASALKDVPVNEKSKLRPTELALDFSNTSC